MTFAHIGKDLHKKTGVQKVVVRKKKEALDKSTLSLVVGHVGGGVRSVSIQGDVLIVQCSSPAAAARARAQSSKILEKTKTRKAFFFS